MDYNKTINLPKTDFPMRAGLPSREPGMLESWEKMDLYHEPRPEQIHQGFHRPLRRHAGLLYPLYPRLGQPRDAHRIRHH